MPPQHPLQGERECPRQLCRGLCQRGFSHWDLPACWGFRLQPVSLSQGSESSYLQVHTHRLRQDLVLPHFTQVMQPQQDMAEVHLGPPSVAFRDTRNPISADPLVWAQHSTPALHFLPLSSLGGTERVPLMLLLHMECKNSLLPVPGAGYGLDPEGQAGSLSPDDGGGGEKETLISKMTLLLHNMALSSGRWGMVSLHPRGSPNSAPYSLFSREEGPSFSGYGACPGQPLSPPIWELAVYRTPILLHVATHTSGKGTLCLVGQAPRPTSSVTEGFLVMGFSVRKPLDCRHELWSPISWDSGLQEEFLRSRTALQAGVWQMVGDDWELVVG